MKIGVLADTHVKDRVLQLHPQVIPLFKAQAVNLILHAGDVSTPGVIDQLAAVAPVHVVQGNADLLLGCHFPHQVLLEIEGVRIAMMHGQGSLLSYVRDRTISLLAGPTSFAYFEERVQRLSPQEADVIVFGHIHAALNRRQNGRLLFNPGSASLPIYKNRQPSIGILTVQDGQASGELLYLDYLEPRQFTIAMRFAEKVHKFFEGITRQPVN
ncbi:MAG: metallophosphoesterase family protein [Anaerolineae bacterium]|nr:metallophosphoesterase family protein [Anaerolineae bacterium]